MPVSQLVEFRAVYNDDEGERTIVEAYQVLTDAVAITVPMIVAARDAWCDAVDAITDLVRVECTASIRSYNTFILPSPDATKKFNNAEDKLYLEFQTAVNGQKWTTQIPGPVGTDFGVDDETVDPTDTDIAAFITLVEGSLSTKWGTGSLKFIKGYRRRSKTRRRVRQGIPTEIGG